VPLDLGHEVGTHSPVAHPVEQLIVRVVASESDLHEVPSRNVFVLDQPANGRAMRDAVPHVLLAAVDVGIEVHYADLARAVDVRACRRIGPQDGVVSAEHHRHRTSLRNLAAEFPDGRH